MKAVISFTKDNWNMFHLANSKQHLVNIECFPVNEHIYL